MVARKSIYLPLPKGSKLILTASSSPPLAARFFAPLGAGVNEENHLLNNASRAPAR